MLQLYQLVELHRYAYILVRAPITRDNCLTAVHVYLFPVALVHLQMVWPLAGVSQVLQQHTPRLVGVLVKI